MRIADALAGVANLGLDTSPFIYYVEDRLPYADRCERVFERITAGTITGYTSVLTLTETLVHPLRNADAALEAEYRSLLLATAGIVSLPLDAVTARGAADVRARYGLRTPDAVQIATALGAGCQAFLTNDGGLRRVTELRVILLDDLSR